MILDRATAGATRSKATMLKRERANEKNVYLVVVEGNESLAVRASDFLCFNSFCFFFSPAAPIFSSKDILEKERASKATETAGIAWHSIYTVQCIERVEVGMDRWYPQRSR